MIHSPLLIGVLAVVVLIVATGLYDRWRQRRLLIDIRRAWGRRGTPGAHAGEIEEIGLYDRLLRAATADSPADGSPSPAAGALDDRSWQDLDLDRVFGVIDGTRSTVGRQLLYRMLRVPARDAAEQERFERMVTALDGDQATRERVQLALRGLAEDTGYAIPSLFLERLPPLPHRLALAPLVPLWVFVFLPLVFFWPPAILLLFVAPVASIALRASLPADLAALVQPFRLLDGLLSAGTAVGGMAELPGAEASMRAMRAANGELSWLRRLTGWLAWDRGSADDLTKLLYDFINLPLLLDVNALRLGIRSVGRHAGSLRHLFDALGELDAAISVASFRRSCAGGWTMPHFLPDRSAPVLRGLVHPLLAEPVANDLSPSLPGALITGSNMSGKTTFIRTVGVNAVLATAIGTVLATEWRAPRYRVMSSIGRADDILAGRSYYMAEAESVLALVRASDSSTPYLFLLDELFRGTNAIERIAGGRAVLAHLAHPPHLVLAATHDFELLEMLAGCYAPWHFTEQVGPTGLTFDFRIRPGPSRTRNAIALLAQLGAPESLVRSAIATSAELDRERGARVGNGSA